VREDQLDHAKTVNEDTEDEDHYALSLGTVTITPVLEDRLTSNEHHKGKQKPRLPEQEGSASEAVPYCI
jgi:hypothetical protein